MDKHLKARFLNKWHQYFIMSKWNTEVADALLTAESLKDSFTETLTYELDRAKESITSDGFTIGGGKLNKGISLVIAIALVIMIFLAGPASAFTVDWAQTPTSAYAGDIVNISATISKVDADAYGADVNAKITGPDGNVLSTILNCDPTTLNYAYGYGYGYGYGGTGYDLTCTGQFTPSIAGSYTIDLITENESSIVTIGSTTIVVNNKTTGGTTVTPIDTSGVVAEYSASVTDLTVEEIRDILEESNLTEEEIQEYLENIASGEVEIERTLVVEKIVENGVTSYTSTFTLEFKNNSDKDLKDVKIVEVVPKEIATTADEISSTHNYKVLLEDPILEFTIPTVKAGEEAEVTYSVNKMVSEAEFASMTNALAKYEEVEETTIVVPEEVEEELEVTQIPTSEEQSGPTGLFGLGAIESIIPLGIIALVLIGLIVLVLKGKTTTKKRK